MKYQPDAYEIDENPSLAKPVYLEFPDASHIICVKAQLLDNEGKLSEFFEFDNKRKIYKVKDIYKDKKKSELI